MASSTNTHCPAAFSSNIMANDVNSNQGQNEETIPLPLPRGVYHPPRNTDTRGPCPMLNTLANHGYIPRTGRGIQAHEITSALHDIVGVSWTVAFLFTHPIFLVHRDPDPDPNSDGIDIPEKWWKACWSRIRWKLIDKPLNTLVFRWGMREPGQYLDVDVSPSNKKMRERKRAKVINLDQLGNTTNAIEHDISLTRRDRAQSQGCMAKQADLVEGLLSFQSEYSPPPLGVARPNPSSGQEGSEGRDVEAAALSSSSPLSTSVLTLQDLAGYRRHRIRQQEGEAAASSRKIKYGKMEHSFGCMEIALFLGVFGLSEEKYEKAPREYARAFFMQERLPFEEGWAGRGTKGAGIEHQARRGWRSWWWCTRRGNRRLGWLELIRTSGRVRKVIGKL